MKIYNLGYQGLSLDKYIEKLKASGVTVLVDVRFNPISRKKGFSKRILNETLQNHGIKYRHFKNLGCPVRIREKLKKDNNWSAYTVAYKKHLNLNINYLLSLIDIAKEENICLLCFESDYNFCHRYLIAQAMAERNTAEIINLK
jgi:uncharacterized protein (DUF488 family)